MPQVVKKKGGGSPTSPTQIEPVFLLIRTAPHKPPASNYVVFSLNGTWSGTVTAFNDYQRAARIFSELKHLKRHLSLWKHQYVGEFSTLTHD